MGAILLLALALRLKGIHNPILDHPAWRQGDTASIAKNFATLQYNIFYPQTNYNGPPPNYVELELQVLPIMAATFYKAFGVYEVIGRLIGIAFGLGTVAVVGFYARWLFTNQIAGLFAALLYAIMPGSFFYSRTFTPDTVMVFFLTCAMYAVSRMLVDQATWTGMRIAGTTALLTLAFLAKPVSLMMLVPIGALMAERARTLRWTALIVMLIVPLLLLYGYDRVVASHAEWHWISGITTLHVLPALRASFQSGQALQAKLSLFHSALTMLATTMIGPALSALAVVGFFFLPPTTRSRTVLWGWLIGGLAYVYVVVTVERVDYYMYVLLPLAALTAAGFLTRLASALAASRNKPLMYAAWLFALVALCGVTYQNAQAVKPYYRYSKRVYRNALSLNATLPANTLVVMGHYDPSVLYYIGRYGWEEDPYLWTPFDEQSAIRKGARFFITIEKNRFSRNVELCAWMQRFPLIDEKAEWPVFVTDPAQVKTGAEEQWRAFRRAEARGKARQWLDAHGLCKLEPRRYGSGRSEPEGPAD
jgi:Dolichyl-phosphate-mannose-protein mannosyltransferase